jgi:hypothetical protein
VFRRVHRIRNLHLLHLHRHHAATAGSPAHLEQFQLTTPDFLPVDSGLVSYMRDDPAVMSCIACADPPVPALHFLRGPTSDLVQFRDADGILRVYFFAVDALTNPGMHDTNPGINVNVGNLKVAQTPEPSTSILMLAGLSLAARRVRRRLARS